LTTTIYLLSITDWRPTVVHKYGKHLLWFLFSSSLAPIQVRVN